MPRRWRHVRAVAGKAAKVAVCLAPGDRDVLAQAAWLHDVGYAAGLFKTGLHALDGARWLRAHGIAERVTALVAYHSCAIYEADERGLADQLRAEFVEERSPTS